jgi:hypothetical protein
VSSKPVEGARARQRLAAVLLAHPILAARIALAHRGGDQGVMAQGIVVVEVRVTQGQGVHPLADQLTHAVLDEIGIAVIDELPGRARDDPGPRLDFPQQQGAAIGADRPTVEATDHHALAQPLKLQLFSATLCDQRVALALLHNSLIAQPLCLRRRPFSIPW